MSDMFFQGWTDIIRTIIVGTLCYAFLVLTLRISGNRTLSRLNAFDLVVSVALGSVFASILLSEGVALAEGMTAIVLLCGLQYAVAWASVRSAGFAKLVRADPIILVAKGQIRPDVMHRARVMRSELDAVLRDAGHADLSTVDLVVLQSDGSFAVLPR